MITQRLPLLAGGLVLALLLAAAPAPAAGEAAPGRVAADRWAVLLCRFADSPVARPFEPTDYSRAFNSDPLSHRRYFREVSYGRVEIDADVYRWRTIGARSAYPGDFWTGGEYDFLNALFKACTKKFDAAVDFSQYEGIAIFLDDRELDVADGTACQYGDTCTVGRRIGVSGAAWVNLTITQLDGVTGWRTIWMANLPSALNEVTDHELLHAYGATHSAAGADDAAAAIECFPYGWPACAHPWDPMSMASTGIPADAHPVAATKVFNTGWIDGERRCNVTTDVTDKEFQLERLAKPRDNNRCLAITIQVPGAPTAWYVVEARFPVGFERDSSPLWSGGGIPGAAVLISRVCTGTDLFCTREPMVVGRDLHPQDGIIDTASASWQPGETFTNYDGRIEVEVVSKGAGFYTVRVTRH
jgi:hypothetical protein